MNYTQMDSIWIEDEPTNKHGTASSTMYAGDQNIELLNSDVPLLRSKNNIELPPLPPSSFFQSTLAERCESSKQSSGGFVKIFKKLSLKEKKVAKKLAPKISTPFGFSHIAHMNEETPITNNSFQMPREPPSPLSIQKSSANMSFSSSSTSSCTANNYNGVSFNTTSGLSSSPGKKRVISNSSSISSNLFQRTASVSTIATTVTNRSRKRSSVTPAVINEEPTAKKLSTKQHQHTNSQSSIENLKRLELTQLHKLCSSNYESNTTDQAFEAWATPDPQNVARQSWIYEDISPFVPKVHPDSIKRCKSAGYSPSYHYNSPLLKRELNLFQDQMEVSFKSDLEYKKMLESIDTFKEVVYSPAASIASTPARRPHQRSISDLRSSRYTFQNQIMDMETANNSDENFNETIVALRAAKFTRMSRIQTHNQDKLNAFGIVTPELEEEEEIQESPESTPKQHIVGQLLPSMLE